MKNLSLIFLVCIFLGAGASTNAQQSISKCFRADWLQGERTVNFRIDGKRVAGTFTVAAGGDEDSSSDATYEFSGTLKGSLLSVAFAGNKLPDVSPSEMKSLQWTLANSGGKETLRIKFRGKNYDTNKYEDRLADFESCEEGYEALARSAKRVRFARGANAASFPVSFATQRERKTFLLNAKAGQEIEVDAISCGITIYRPDKSEYDEPAIDMWGSERLAQSGDYLFVIKPAGEAGTCSVRFKVTN